MTDTADLGGRTDTGLCENEPVSEQAKPSIPNVLAQRYASPAMTGIWSPAAKVVAERKLWVAVLAAQHELGVPAADGAIDAYQRVVDAGDRRGRPRLDPRPANGSPGTT